MKENRGLILTSALIIVLSLCAVIPALVPAGGESYTEVSRYGEEVLIHGQGIYGRDSHSYAVQAVAQDWVTLIIGIPLLVISTVLSARGSYKGALMRTGVLGYFLYTYMSYSFLVMYNRLFLIYVALFSLSLFGFIVSFSKLKIETIDKRVRPAFPRRSTAIFFLFIGVMLLFMWLGRIIPALPADDAPFGLECYTTLVIQAMDLGIIVPLSFITAAGLLKRRNLGYALSAVVVFKGVTLFSAISVMAVLMKLSGVEISSTELIVFPAATAVNFIFCLLILRSID